MRTIALVLLLSSSFLISACQGPQGINPNTQNTGAEPEYVQGADGSFFSISCLRAHAQEIQQSGRSAASQCATSGSSVQSEMASRGQAHSRSSSYSYLFYYYYPPSYWTTYYGSSYNYNNQYNSYFCSYIFGTSWNSSCYSNIFGYNNTYSTGSNCYSCYGSSYGPYCYNSCWYGYSY